METIHKRWSSAFSALGRDVWLFELVIQMQVQQRRTHLVSFLTVVSGILLFQNCSNDELASKAPQNSPAQQEIASQNLNNGNKNSTDLFISSPNAAQLIYQNSVPHTDRLGTPMSEFQPGISFFPIWSYGNKHPSTSYICHPDAQSKMWREELPADSTRLSNLKLLQNASFNTGQFFGAPDYSEIFLREASRLNMQSLFYWYPLDSGLTSTAWETWSGYSHHLDFITKNGQHSNILGWIPTEETGRYFSQTTKTMEGWITFYHSMINQIRTVSPKAVFIVDNLWVENQTEKPFTDGSVDAWLYFHTQDSVAGLDNYIQNLKTISTFDQSNGIPRAGKFIQSAYSGTRPYWPMVNVYEEYNEQGEIVNGSEFPSPTQLRNLVYNSIVHGATGIGYFGIDDYAFRRENMLGIRPDTPAAYLTDPNLSYGACDQNSFKMLTVTQAKAEESILLWNTVAQINSELQQLSSAILSKTSRQEYSVEVSGKSISPTPIRTMLKEFGGESYLIAINQDRVKLRSRISLPAPNHFGTIQVLFENRTIRPADKATGSSFIDDFSEFAVHVYKFRKDP